MVHDDCVYVGRRARQTDPELGPHSVVVGDGPEYRALAPRHGAAPGSPFAWGYVGGGPTALSRAILFDILGFDAPDVVSEAFLADVVAQLPAESGDFALSRREVHAWLEQRLIEACAPRFAYES